ncbi:MAG TPA: NAD(P)H-hydrate dehydratase [Anaerolineales bacterium]|nr:NAD(P)H-hydrate dehydratase [Anaerolineales bacterium]
MPKILTVEQMKRIETASDAAGWTYAQMMERAGQAVADAVVARIASPAARRVVILTGSGNNGGDGLVAGRWLADAGMQVAVYLVRDRPAQDPHVEALRERGALIARAEDDQRQRVLANLVQACDVLIDAVLGTGARLPLKGEVAQALLAARSAVGERPTPPLRVAVDCPSGLDCDTGEVAPETMAADVTVTLAAAKPGLLRLPGVRLAGEILVADIGIDPQQPELSQVNMEWISVDDVRRLLPDRPRDAHKGTFGTLVIAAGSVNYPGSAGLAGTAAYRVGTGLVTLAVPAGVQRLLASSLLEATWIVLPEEMGVIARGAADVLLRELGRATALLLGPGLGRDETTRGFVERLLAHPKEGSPRAAIGFVHEPEAAGQAIALAPLVVDADGLRLLASLPDWPKKLPSRTILTPHPGEMAALTGQSLESLQLDRLASARGWAAEWGHIVVLKGAHTVVAEPDGRTAVLPFATAALARAGTGDVLAGAIAGLRAQGLEAYESALLGSYLHGRAGEIAAMRAGAPDGVLAGDVAALLPESIRELRGDARA